MKARLIITLFLIVTKSSVSQGTFFLPADSISKKRVVPVTIGIGSFWTGSMITLHEVWYKDVEKSEFHTFNDGGNWLQMDKIGHIYANYKISELCGNAYQWSGMNPKKAALIGTGIGLGYQTTLELFDAFSTEWGFSWYDVTSNMIGAGFYLGQELSWGEQRVQLKFSYHPTEFAELRPSVLGSNFQERLLKDYNGQSYWMSFNPFLFSENSNFPKWLCFSFGYSAHAKIIGDQELYIDYTTNQPTLYKSQREFLFSLDIDFSRIPVKKPWLKMVLKQLNYLKVPFPTLILRDGKLIGRGLYF